MPAEHEPSLWQYGILGLCTIALIYVIKILWKDNKDLIKRAEAAREAQVEKDKKDIEALATERATLASERERIRAELDARYNTLLKETQQKLHDEHAACRAREDVIRREHAEALEALAEERRRSDEQLIAVLEKINDRFVFNKTR